MCHIKVSNKILIINMIILILILISFLGSKGKMPGYAPDWHVTVKTQTDIMQNYLKSLSIIFKQK